MEKKEQKNEITELRGFLIKNFLVILAVVSVAEYVVLQLINSFFLPAFDYFFSGKISWNGRLSMSQSIFYLLILLAELTLAAVASVLPVAAQAIVGRLIAMVEKAGRSDILQIGQNAFSQLSRMESLLLFATLVVIFALLILPYAIGALWYARITTKKVRELREKREALQEEYDRRRNLMLSDIAHDLRTPITTVAGYAKALADGMVTDPQKVQSYLDAIQAKSARMEELIQLLFEYVKISSEGFALDRKPANLAELVRKNAALIYADAESGGMELEIDIPEEPYMENVDEVQFGRALTNLLNNALRHNSAGARILLSLRVEADAARITVADTGEKIAPELAEHLFEPFVMGDESRSSKGGSGLGLSIASQIMQMHGWTLSYSEDIPDYSKGFVIECPRSHTAILPEPAAAKA